MPYLSVIVPIYNVEKYLRQCVDSILAQTFRDFECILVDDGSPDGCPQICDEYSERDERIRVIHKENGGLVSARQAGIRIAEGIYIGYVDSDDFVLPEMFEKLCNVAKHEKADIIACDFQSYQDGDEICHHPGNLHWSGFYDRERYRKEILPKALYYGNFFLFGISPAVWQRIYRRELFVKHQLEVKQDISLGEDAACSYFAYLDAESVAFVNEKLYFYRKNADSITQKKDTRKYKKTMCLLDFMWEKLQRYDMPQFNDQFLYYAVHMMTNIVYDHLRLGEYKSNKETIFSIYQEMAESSCGHIVLEEYKALDLPKNIKAYLRLISERNSFTLHRANYARIRAGLLRRLRSKKL